MIVGMVKCRGNGRDQAWHSSSVSSFAPIGGLTLMARGGTRLPAVTVKQVLTVDALRKEPLTVSIVCRKLQVFITQPAGPKGSAGFLFQPLLDALPSSISTIGNAIEHHHGRHSVA